MSSKIKHYGDGTVTIWIDVDPVNGNDENSGKKGEGSVKTLKRAKELLRELPTV